MACSSTWHQLKYHIFTLWRHHDSELHSRPATLPFCVYGVQHGFFIGRGSLEACGGFLNSLLKDPVEAIARMAPPTSCNAERVGVQMKRLRSVCRGSYLRNRIETTVSLLTLHARCSCISAVALDPKLRRLFGVQAFVGLSFTILLRYHDYHTSRPEISCYPNSLSEQSTR